MTLQELSQNLKLHEKLEREEEMLESLQAAALPGTQVLDGMPHAPGMKDKVGDLAIEIADLKERIRYLKEAIYYEEANVSKFIATIGDVYIRTIFRLRFMRCLTWSEVAYVIGGKNTEEGVKSTCYRYLSSENCNGVTRDDA